MDEVLEALKPFDPEFIKAVEKLEVPPSVWMVFFKRAETPDGQLCDKLIDCGYTDSAVRAHLGAIANLPTEKLIQTFLDDPVAANAACGSLQVRTTHIDKDRAVQLVQNNIERERLLGVLMLTYSLGAAHESEVIPILHKLAAIEDNEEVLEALCFALYQLQDTNKIQHIKHLATHKNASIRYAVSACCFGTDDPDGIDILMVLARDRDPAVRNWSVTGLGQSLRHTLNRLADFRTVFIESIEDEDRFTRLEALDALSQLNLKNKRILEVLITELEASDVPLIAIKAAIGFADPTLYPTLNKLHLLLTEDSPIFENLKKAIEVCRPR